MCHFLTRMTDLAHFGVIALVLSGEGACACNVATQTASLLVEARRAAGALDAPGPPNWPCAKCSSARQHE